MEVNKTI